MLRGLSARLTEALDSTLNVISAKIQQSPTCRLLCIQGKADQFSRLNQQSAHAIPFALTRVGTAVKRDSYAEHHAIIEALLDENPERIGAVLTAHANYSEIIALRTLNEAGIQQAQKAAQTPKSMP